MTEVCLVAENTYPHALGGVGVWVDRLVRALPDVTFSVASLRDPAALDAPARLAPPANVREIAVLPVDPATGACAGELPDAAVYHALCAGPASVAAADAARAGGAALLLGEHGLAWREALHGVTGCRPMRRPERRRGDERLERARWARALARDAACAYATADAVTAVSHEARRWQRALGADPASTHVLANPAAPAPLRAHHATAPVVGRGGRGVAIKDVETFLRAARLVADALPLARFLVAGPLDVEPEYAARCAETAARLGLTERLTFAGPLELDAWRRQVDVVVLTSRSEGQPLVLLEAMAAGIPVVATAVGGVPELLAHGGGALVAPGDEAAIARAVAALADPAARRRLGEAGRRHVRLRHDARTHARAHAALYERLAARRG